MPRRTRKVRRTRKSRSTRRVSRTRTRRTKKRRTTRSKKQKGGTYNIQGSLNYLDEIKQYLLDNNHVTRERAIPAAWLGNPNRKPTPPIKPPRLPGLIKLLNSPSAKYLGINIEEFTRSGHVVWVGTNTIDVENDTKMELGVIGEQARVSPGIIGKRLF
jgi:hypothetical protein